MFVAIAVALIIIGLALGPISRLLEQREAQKLEEERLRQWAESPKSIKGIFIGGRGPELPPPREPKGSRVLICFAIIVIIFGLITLVYFWPSIRNNDRDIFLWVWLFLTMVFGMFVQVLVTNKHSGRRLFAVEASQLLFPLLFSIVVFYPIWGICSSNQKDFFSIYTAFLNGYFWETIVTGTKPPAAPDD